MYMENVKEHYWRYSLITIILGLGVILFFKITPFLGGILGAFTIYILLRGQMFHLTEKLNMRPAFAALLLLGETILCFLIPITLAIWLVINKTQNINLDPTVLLNTGQHIADLVQEKTGFDVLDRGNLLKAASILPQIGQFLVGSISSFAVNVVVLIFILYFMLIGGRKMENYLYTLFPFSDQNKDEVLNEINMIVKSNAIGIPLFGGYTRYRSGDRLLYLSDSRSAVIWVSHLYRYDHSHCRDRIGLGSVGGLYGFKRRLGTCLGIDYLCLACHYERR